MKKDLTGERRIERQRLGTGCSWFELTVFPPLDVSIFGRCIGRAARSRSRHSSSEGRASRRLERRGDGDRGDSARSTVRQEVTVNPTGRDGRAPPTSMGPRRTADPVCGSGELADEEGRSRRAGRERGGGYKSEGEGRYREWRLAARVLKQSWVLLTHT